MYSNLSIAAQFGHTALVAYFIARGVNADLQDRGGMTALMWASWKIPSLDPVRLLLTLGGNPSLADNSNGNTPLQLVFIFPANLSMLLKIFLCPFSHNFLVGQF